MANYETKDTGQHQEFSTGMHREVQTDKPRFDLLLPLSIPYDEQLLTRFARLMERGMRKYSIRNWEHARTQEELDHFKSSFLRHAMQWMSNETDEDHASACMFNLMGAEYVKYRIKNGVSK